MDLTNQEVEQEESSEERQTRLQNKLLDACTYSTLPYVKEILDEGASPEVMVNTYNGERPLVYALISREKDDIAAYIIEQGVETNYLFDDETTLLHDAVTNNLTATVEALLSCDIKKNQQSEDGRSALFGVKNLPMLKRLIDSGVGAIDEIDNDGNTLLHVFADDIYEQSEASRDLSLHLVKNIDVNLQNDEGNTAIMLLLQGMFIEENEKFLFNSLLEQKALVNFINHEGDSALQLSITNSDIPIEFTQKVLEAGANVNEINEEGLQAIHYGAQGDKNLFFLLVEHGADINALTESMHYSPLSLAAYNNQVEIVEYLLSQEVSVNQTSFNGETALNRAMLNEDADVIQLIKNKGGVVNSQEEMAQIKQKNEKSKAEAAENKLTDYDRLKRSIKSNDLDEIKMHYINVLEDESLVFNDYEIAEALIRHSDAIAFQVAVDNGLNLFVANTNGYTLLHIAVYFNKIGIVKILLKKGLDVNAKNNQGYSVYEMTKNSSIEMIEVLLNAGITRDDLVEVNMANLSLHMQKPELAAYFVEQGYKFPEEILKNEDFLLKTLQAESIETLQYLLTNGLDIESRVSVYGDMITLLHAVVLLDSEKLALFILDAGGDPNARDSSGKPIYRMLISQGNQTIIDAFYENGGNVNDVIGEHVSKKTPLAEAFEYGRVETAILLVDKGANIEDVDFLFKNTAIHEAARLGSVKLLKSIINKGGNVHQLNETRHAALDIAIKYGKKEAEDYLRKMEALSPDESRF